MALPLFRPDVPLAWFGWGRTMSEAAQQLKKLLAMPAVELIKIPYSSSKSMHGGMCATLCRPQN